MSCTYGSSTSSVKHQSETHIITKHYDETKKKAQWRHEARKQENYKQDHDEPEHKY